MAPTVLGAMSEPVYHLVDLPPGLAVEGDLLGTRWQVAPAPTPCTLLLPRRPPAPLGSFERRRLLVPDASDASEAVHSWWQHSQVIDLRPQCGATTQS